MNLLASNLERANSDIMSGDTSFEQTLELHFVDIWSDFLALNIFRMKKMTELAGGSINAMIMQVVYWHELMLLKEQHVAENYADTVALIATFSSNKDADNYSQKNQKKLTISLIADMTGLAYETVRRHTHKLAEAGILKETKNVGLCVERQSEFHQNIVKDLNMFEKKMLLSQVTQFSNLRNSDT